MHQPLPKSPLQLQDATTTSLTVIIIDNLVECHTTNGQLADFKCRRNALGDDTSLFVSGVIFLYRNYVSWLVTLCDDFWWRYDWQMHFKISSITFSNRHECNDNNTLLKFLLFRSERNRPTEKPLLIPLNVTLISQPVRTCNGKWQMQLRDLRLMECFNGYVSCQRLCLYIYPVNVVIMSKEQYE